MGILYQALRKYGCCIIKFKCLSLSPVLVHFLHRFSTSLRITCMYHLRAWNRLVMEQCLTNFFPQQWSSTSYMITSVWKLALPSYTIYSNSLPVPSLTFYGPPPRSFLRFCDTRISSNRAGAQTSSLLTFIHASATDLWKRIPERIASSVNNSPSLVLLKTDLQTKINQKI